MLKDKCHLLRLVSYTLGFRISWSPRTPRDRVVREEHSKKGRESGGKKDQKISNLFPSQTVKDLHLNSYRQRCLLKDFKFITANYCEDMYPKSVF